MTEAHDTPHPRPRFPALSVILPVCNGENYIASALSSVLAQTFEDWEAIVVDDGSADGTAQAVAPFQADTRVRVIRQENRGLAAARNRGVAEARGIYVAFLDADDLWQPAYLARMAAALERAPEAVAAFSGWQYMDEAGTPLPQSIIPFDGQLRRLDEELAWKNAILPSAVVARRQAVQRVGGFDEQLAACEDWDMWLRLRSLGTFAAVPQILMLYRAHAESMTDNVEGIERERLKVNEKHLGSLAGPPAEWPQLRGKAVGYTFFASALGYFRRRDTARGVEKVKRSLECWPEFVDQDEFYYELGCAYQRRGLRGTPATLDLSDSAELIRSLLFRELNLPGGRGQRSACWGHACLILSRLAVVAGDRAAARRCALRASVQAPLGLRGASLRALARSVLPGDWVQALRRGTTRRTTAPD